VQRLMRKGDRRSGFEAAHADADAEPQDLPVQHPSEEAIFKT
jgi:hypothetical protein